LLKHVRFPAIHTLDTSKTPKAGEIRIAGPVLASADIENITRQIQAIQATQQDDKHKSGRGAPAPKSLVPVQAKPASPPKEVTARPSQLGAAILAARTAAGLSQTELAAKIKTAQTNIARLERGGSMPSTNTLQRIAKATGHKLLITFSRTA
jgi:ribosome-binding protein aMBF1 (putative translation factor)